MLRSLGVAHGGQLNARSASHFDQGLALMYLNHLIIDRYLHTSRF